MICARRTTPEVDEIRNQIVRLPGSVIEAIPRATNVLLDGDLEGAEYLISRTTRSTPGRSTSRRSATG